MGRKLDIEDEVINPHLLRDWLWALRSEFLEHRGGQVETSPEYLEQLIRELKTAEMLANAMTRELAYLRSVVGSVTSKSLRPPNSNDNQITGPNGGAA